MGKPCRSSLPEQRQEPNRIVSNSRMNRVTGAVVRIRPFILRDDQIGAVGKQNECAGTNRDISDPAASCCGIG